MSLALHFHPLSPFCQKVLVALYESDTPFTPTHRHLAACYERLLARPSFARAVAEARPYFHLFPQA